MSEVSKQDWRAGAELRNRWTAHLTYSGQNSKFIETQAKASQEQLKLRRNKAKWRMVVWPSVVTQFALASLMLANWGTLVTLAVLVPFILGGAIQVFLVGCDYGDSARTGRDAIFALPCIMVLAVVAVASVGAICLWGAINCVIAVLRWPFSGS